MNGDDDKRQFLDPHALSRLAAMPLFARRTMVGSVSGMHASPHRGASVEFAEYRRYVPGDDLRRLDWRAFGRTDRFYVKEFEADTNLRMCLILDTSGSMGYGSEPTSKMNSGAKLSAITKLRYAQRLAGSLAYLAVKQGDAVGLTTISETIQQTIPARRTPSHLRGINDVLEQAAAGGETHLVEGLHEFAETARERALVVILSDLFVPPAEFRGALDHLRFRKHDVAVFHLLDPQELQFDFRRPTRFVDLEGNATLLADPSEIADRYQQAVEQYLSEIRSLALEAAVDYHRITTDEDYEQVLMRFLAGRVRGSSLR